MKIKLGTKYRTLALKNLFSKLIITFLFINACSSSNIIQSSRDDKPSWIGGIENNYIIVEGIGQNFDKAKLDAQNKIQKRIVNSVANTISDEVIIKRHLSTENKITIYKKEFIEYFKSSSSSLGFIKGIDLSKAEDFYWEKTKKDSLIINYHIKYPFTSDYKEKLITNWERHYSKYENIIDTLCRRNNYSYFEDILEDKNELLGIREKVDQFLQERIDNKLRQLNYEILNTSINIIENNHGEVEFSFSILSDKIMTKINPVLISECTRTINYTSNEGINRLYYDYEPCFFNKGNRTAIVKYNFPNNDVFKIIDLPLPEVNINLSLTSPVYLDGLKKGILLAKDKFNVSLTLNNLSTIGVVIKSVLIKPYNFQTYDKPIYTDGLESLIDAKSKKSIKFRYSIFSVKKLSKYNLCEVEVIFKSIFSEDIKRKKFARVEFITAWN